ncbi:MAG: NAD-dependent DNA ligase LigA [Lachnospiraceae bacterium]|nr:NAD-dependent DNA ligase LigA [Lachnospiraceae bacterium]
MDKTARMKELVDLLKNASKAYYQDAEEIMSNFEYDQLYDELKALEEETGVVLAGSVTQSVGYEVLSELPKEEHASPMLSLDKTKSREELKEWLHDQEAILSWKLDGLTIVLTYQNGELYKAVTRGNGEVGEVITANAKVFMNVPLKIPFKGELILRGEAVISYEDFDRINDSIADIDAKYKNPRNLCSGSVRQLNSEITAKRNVRFYAFALVSADHDFHNSRMEQFAFLQGQGFDVVEHYLVNPDTILDRIQYFADSIENNPIPSDGLVLVLNDIAYGISLGRTAKFPRDAIAFKWADEIRETTLKEIEWSPSRTGLINPVAIFEPVELEGTTVSRASVHNVSIVKQLQLGIGDRITVYKANMIIPQIADNLTRSGNAPIASVCPACGQPTRISRENDVETLRCDNPDCSAKKIKSFTLFVSRDAMNIDGISESTLEKFIAHGLIREFADLYHLSEHKDTICSMEGFGELSYENLIKSIEQSRNVSLPKLIYSLGIPNIGLSNAKVICRAFDFDVNSLLDAKPSELSAIDGVGDVIAESFVQFFAQDKNRSVFDKLLKEVHLEKVTVDTTNDAVSGKTFVITGSLTHFENRNDLKEIIENQGGKVAGSVSAKTDYLINNDVNSNSSKNKKAKELNVPIIPEEEAMRLLNLS